MIRRLSGRGVVRMPGPRGRPRTRPIPDAAPASPRPAAGTVEAQRPTDRRAASGSAPRTPAAMAGALPPRLLDLPGAAAYLRVSVWTIRDYDAAGLLPRVRLPLPHGGELRKVLFDRVDLDSFVDRWKDGPT